MTLKKHTSNSEIPNKSQIFAILSVLTPVPTAAFIYAIIETSNDSLETLLLLALAMVALPPVIGIGFLIAARIHKESWIGLAIFGVVLSFLPLIWTFYTAISG